MGIIKSKSKKAFDKNVEMEMKSGKQQDQALAIAYDIQRRSKSKKMAHGGPIDRVEDKAVYVDKPDRGYGAIIFKAEGGEVKPKSIAEAIRTKRFNGDDSIYAHPEVEQADLARNAEEDANMEDQLSFDAMRKENYSESEGLMQLDSPEDSNLHGHDIESDKHDRISQMRKRVRNMR